jgi:hypothetical protein
MQCKLRNADSEVPVNIAEGLILFVASVIDRDQTVRRIAWNN